MKKTALICVACMLLISTVAAQQRDSVPKLPDTQSGRRVAAYLKAFNSGDEQQMRAFFADNVSADALQMRPVDARLKVYRQMRLRMETIELRRVGEASETALTVLVESRRDGWFEMSFEFEQDPLHKLLGLRVEEAEAPTGAPANTSATSSASAPKMTEAEAIASVEGHLNQLVAADEFSGAVLVARDGKPIFQRAYGLASKEYDIPNRTDTKFNLGSINKIFTQIAIGQLMEQGKLSFDDKLGKHLPDYPNHDAAEKVTIRQLLDMSSGIGDFFGPAFAATAKDRLRTINDFLPLFAANPLKFEPGTKRQYSNGGYIVLGAIIEKVSGQTYYDYVREHVFKPAGMQNTESYESDIPIQNLASGYTLEGVNANAKGGRRNNVYTRPAKGSSAGGGYSTAEDLLKFALALQSGKLRLPDFREPKEAARTDSPDAKPRGFPGMGVAGGADGINALLDVEAGSGGYVTIVMSNYDPPIAQKVGKQIREWLARVKN